MYASRIPELVWPARRLATLFSRGSTVRSGSRPADRAGAVGRTRHGAADRVGSQGQTTGAPPPDGEDRWTLNWYRNEHRWLRDSVQELTQQLRLRTIMLEGALALSTLMLVMLRQNAVVR